MSMQKSYLLSLLVVVTSWYHVTDGYILGPPEAACAEMTPSHGANTPSTAEAPFTLTASATSYTPNAQLTFTIAKTGTTGFKGFFVQARKTSDSSRIGTFTTTGTTTDPCANSGGGAISHNENAEKSSVTLTWTAPSTSAVDIQFVATVVQQFDTYWTSLTSPVISGAGATVTTIPTMAATMAVLWCLLSEF